MQLTGIGPWERVEAVARRLDKASAWRERLANALGEVSQAVFASVATCPPGRVIEAQVTAVPSEHNKLIEQVMLNYLPQVESGPDGWAEVRLITPGVYAPLEMAHNSKLAAQLKAELLKPAGIDGLVNAFFVGSRGEALGWVTIAAKRSAAELLRDSAGLANVARAAAETLEGALDLVEGCGVKVPRMSSPTSKLLTARESQILHLISSGLSDVNVATRLGISEQTVGTHLRRIYRKLGVHSRTEAVARLST